MNDDKTVSDIAFLAEVRAKRDRLLARATTASEVLDVLYIQQLIREFEGAK